MSNRVKPMRPYPTRPGRIEQLESRVMPATLLITLSGGGHIEVDLSEVTSIQVSSSQVNTDSFCTPAVTPAEPAPTEATDQVLTSLSFLVSSFGPQEDAETVAAEDDGVVDQRDFLVTQAAPIRAIGLPVPTPSNPFPTITPAMVDAALARGLRESLLAR